MQSFLKRKNDDSEIDLFVCLKKANENVCNQNYIGGSWDGFIPSKFAQVLAPSSQLHTANTIATMTFTDICVSDGNHTKNNVGCLMISYTLLILKLYYL